MALTHGHPSFLLLPPPPPHRTHKPHDPLIASRFIFASSALDDAVTARGTLVLLFEPGVDDRFKWRVAGGVKPGLILCG